MSLYEQSPFYDATKPERAREEARGFIMDMKREARFAQDAVCGLSFDSYKHKRSNCLFQVSSAILTCCTCAKSLLEHEDENAHRAIRSISFHISAYNDELKEFKPTNQFAMNNDSLLLMFDSKVERAYW